MSSISQNILMALTATVNKYASSNARSVHRREHRPANTTAGAEVGRRCFLLAAAVIAAPQPSSDSRTELLKRYLKKSEENKTKNEKEDPAELVSTVLQLNLQQLDQRLDSYYKRNYGDYFNFVEGSLQGKKAEELTESEKGILSWLQKNK